MHVKDVLGLLDQRHVDHVAAKVERSLPAGLVLPELGDEVGGPLDPVGRRRKSLLDYRKLRRMNHLNKRINKTCFRWTTSLSTAFTFQGMSRMPWVDTKGKVLSRLVRIIRPQVHSTLKYPQIICNDLIQNLKKSTLHTSDKASKGIFWGRKNSISATGLRTSDHPTQTCSTTTTSTAH